MLIQLEDSKPLNPQKNTAIGIDLGTTNSVVAYVKDGQPVMLSDDEGHRTTPSQVYYGDRGQIIVGRAADALIALNPDRGVRSVKRLMGKGLHDLKRVLGQFKYNVHNTSNKSHIKLSAGDVLVSPEEVSAEILKSLKAMAEKNLGHEVTQAVITVPAYFDDAQRIATKRAAELAGLEVLRLIAEPTAAAFAYGLEKGSRGYYAIYDLGGGTFDFSLLKLSDGIFQVLSTGGDNTLGGDDFDVALAESILDELGFKECNFADLKTFLGDLKRAREALSNEDHVDIESCVSEQVIKYTLTRDKVQGCITPLLEKTLKICRNTLDDAELSVSDIDGVVLVGGATRTPLLREKVEAFLGKKPLTDIHPDEVVGAGAALQAHSLTEGHDALLLDVVPLSLGIETMGGLAEKMIHRNTPLPASRSQDFTTYEDNQTALAIHVVQGERELVDDLRSLAKFKFSGIPPMPAGGARVTVTFNVDADSLLTVSAKEFSTGVHQDITVTPSYGLSRDDMMDMVRESMDHGADDLEARLLREAFVEGEHLIRMTESALRKDGSLLESAERAIIEKALGVLKVQLQGKNRQGVLDAIKGLEGATQDFATRKVNAGLQKALDKDTHDILKIVDKS